MGRRGEREGKEVDLEGWGMGMGEGRWGGGGEGGVEEGVGRERARRVD